MKISKYLKPLLLLIFPFVLSSCSNLASNYPSSKLLVEYDQKLEISFEGKGVGAGIALMSTMGPMGMAIGVAIDAGIAKDLNASIDKSGKSLDSILVNEASIYFDEVVLSNSLNQADYYSGNDVSKIKVKSLRFHAVPGENDPACFKIDFELTALSLKIDKQVFSVYLDNTDAGCRSEHLQSLKEDSELIVNVIENTLQLAFKNVRNASPLGNDNPNL